MSFLKEWSQELLIVSGASLVLLLVGALVGPWMILRLPADTFSESRPARPAGARQGEKRWLAVWGRNLLGGLLVGIGVLLLVLPGQGVLTILAGLMMMDFRGKRRALRRIARRPPVRRSLNWFRGRFDRQPFVFDDD